MAAHPEPCESTENCITTLDIVNEAPNKPIISEVPPVTSPEKKIVADLGKYIETCYYGNETAPSERRPIFNQDVGHYRPQLKQDRVNRIILYPGCFNPPHRGHQAMINCAFSCSQDIDVIAAIVVPVGTTYSENLSKKFEKDVWFTRAQRVQLWRGDNGPHDWLWVYDRGSGEWEYFRNHLETAIKTDGFSFEFIYLGGPDHIGRNYCKYNIWDCDNMLVSDIGREADFVGEDETLLRIGLHGDWKPILYPNNKPHPLEAVREMAPWLRSSLSLAMLGQESNDRWIAELLQREYIRMIAGMRICWNKLNEGSWVRFIPASHGVMHMSSTDIRYIIKTCPPDELLKKLKRKALRPELLVQWVRESKHCNTAPPAL
ncbi:hypothetical protein F4813DRAFT_223096 [Daldinia decipiens]|uniref:uncharacterized protein n=1 Tax=Daldinia decipiens TaxID=326647 RepID=UPI0020C549D9|nr:uncharacterized protein F4813DRAFT_223096 [Daldinia decipiens]KAI1661274.1 hypothetical protein F4813DRAFT_223096 [Daldinia decipiens]